LTVREASNLAKALKIAKEREKPFLKPTGIVGSSVLHIDAINGKAIWFTKVSQRELYFVDNLRIPKGNANMPPMLWVANRESLYVFALYSNRRPTTNTQLYNAPFFNVYENGNVCLVTIDVNIKQTASLEEFITSWESYFFNSYFSHLMPNHIPVKGNCVSLWENQIATGAPFPKEILTKVNKP
jgi:PRTRC genetic system protein B